MNHVTFTYVPYRSVRDQERQAALDLQRSFRGGNLTPAYVVAIRAAEAALMREGPDNEVNRKARMLSWVGIRCFELPLLAAALPLLRTYAEQAENDGERSLATKAIAVVNEILDLP